MSYSLLIQSAEKIDWKPLRRDLRKLKIGSKPDLYVKIYQNEHETITTHIERDQFSPKWNFNCDLSAVSALHTLTFRLYHDALGPDEDLGHAEVSIAMLLDMCKASEVTKLDIKHGSKIRGRLLVRLTKISLDQAVQNAADALSELSKPTRPELIASGVKGAVDTADRIKLTDALEGVLSILEPIVKVGDELTKIHPYANAAWKILTSVYNAVKNEREVDENISKLAAAMAELYSSAKNAGIIDAKTASLQESLRAITMLTLECGNFIRNYQGHGFWGRLNETVLRDAGQQMDELTARLRDLRSSLTSKVAIQSLSISIQSLRISAEIQRDIQGLVHSEYLQTLRKIAAPGQSPNKCLSGTRGHIITWIVEWFFTPSDTNIFWLSGVAGSGKSTLAMSISESFRAQQRLGRLIYFRRNLPAGNDSIAVLHEIVYGITGINVEIKRSICAKLAQDPNIINAPLETQFEELLLAPLTSANTQFLCGPYVVVIDALDECPDETRTSITALIANYFHKLPSAFRFLITSRPDPGIAELFRSRPHSILEHALDIKSKETETDIHLYIRSRLQDVRARYRLSDNWPPPQAIGRLVEDAGGLFIWAATALNLVSGFDPQGRLENLLEHPFSSSGDLDQLYTIALQTNPDWQDRTFSQMATKVLGAIILAKDSLTDDMIDKLFNLNTGFSARLLQYLGSVVQWSKGQPARPLHATFGDFLTNQTRCPPSCFIDVQAMSTLLALGCLRTLHKELRFNICQIPSSYLLNSEIPGLQKRIRELEISSPLLIYSVQFWADHLSMATPDEILLSLQNFLFERFLYWLEVLSVRNQVGWAQRSLETVRNTTWVSFPYPL
ncbi:WD40 repeat-like protein [Mycena venus]|uniref:WD40 repeat-like protein n=1 Tax=Mycena venus TaxID=2733690 RepID=A0A8H6YBP7_9AGAR|nr:WD40 repeat-like protein [Mycena venus]